MILDAHQHVWRIGKNDCTWPSAGLPAIHRDFELKEIEDAARMLGVGGSVLVQSQESDRDTDWLIDLAEKSSFVLGVVGWADMLAPTAAARIAGLSSRKKLRGLRPMLQGLADDWILDGRLTPAIESMIASDLSFDAPVLTRHLPSLFRFAKRWPKLLIVIDHGAKPEIATNVWEPWASAIAAFGPLPNVFCKLSGLVTEAGSRGSPDALLPYAAHMFEVFGSARMMWGSDWPVVNLASDYRTWFAMSRAIVGQLRGGANAIFGTTAAAFYRL
jgi:L-fuconolactonase